MGEPREPSPDVRTIMLSVGAGAAVVGLLVIGFALVTVRGGRAAPGSAALAVSQSPVPQQREIAQDADNREWEVTDFDSIG